MSLMWQEVTSRTVCPICQHDSWCRLSTDGIWAICRRVDSGSGKYRQDRNGSDFWLYRLDGQTSFIPEPWEPEPNAPCADEATRDRVYRVLLSQLGLDTDHHTQLRQRGLSEEAIVANSYRTWPAKGRSALAKTLREYYDEATLRTIPGAYVKTENGGSWWSLAGAPGLLIPIRNVMGQIVALKVRSDKPNGDSPRYSTVSSKTHKGPGPGANIHVPCHDTDSDTSIVRITEGELKADVTQWLTGIFTVSVPGVSNWRLIIPVLQALKARTVFVAFDADSRTNPHVAAALERTRTELTERGWDVRIETWPAAWGKGIDDILVAGYVPNIEDKSSPSNETVVNEPPHSIFEKLTQSDAEPELLIRQVLKEPDDLGALALAAETETAQWEGWILKLRDTGAKISTIDALKRAVTALRREKRGLRITQKGEHPSPPRIQDLVSDAPVPADAIVPPGWSLSSSGVFEEKRRINVDTNEPEVVLTAIAPVPIVITGRLRDVADGTESVRLEWPRDGRWIHATVRRAIIASARTLVDLADQGLPVTTNTASALAQFLADLEAANLDILPRAQVSATLGWQHTEGSWSFLWGHTLLRPKAHPATLNSDLESLRPQEWDSDAIAFHGADRGDIQIADSFHAAGTEDAWKAAIYQVAPYPRAAIALYASLSVPCLALLGAPNFIIDWCFTTSTGKTTTLRMAASCWGNPDERDVSSVLGTWDVTRTWIERMSTVLNGLPLCLDDTKRARHPKLVGQTLYDVASGRGRGRGTPRGMQRAGSWTTVLLSTGESPAVQFTQDGGTRARTITLWGGPFGRPTQETARLITQLDAAIRTNYGHAGPRFVQWLLDHHADWIAWRALFHTTQEIYQQRAADNAVAVRLATYFATLDVVSQLVHQAFNFPWDATKILNDTWTTAIEESQEADRAAQALATVITWAELNAPLFWGRHVDTYDIVRIPPGGWAGKWDADDGWNSLGIAPQRIQDILTKAGWEVGEIDGPNANMAGSRLARRGQGPQTLHQTHAGG